MEQTIGMETPVEEMDESQRRVLAYHEAGHAVAQYYVMPDQKIVRATIVRLSTGAQGHVMPVDTIDQHVEPVMRYAYEIIVSLAGRAAEKILTGEMFASTGGDYRNVQINLWKLAVYGYFGPRLAMRFGAFGGDNVAAMMAQDDVLERYWLQMEQVTEKLLRRHWKEVTALAEELLIKNTLNGKEVVEVIEANQSLEAFKEEEIIPRTLAAIRAQALAEARSEKRNGTLLNDSYASLNGSNGSSEYPVDEPVVVINGAANSTASLHEKASAERASDAGPALINEGVDTKPEILNDPGSER
jgi:hypothetical protein